MTTAVPSRPLLARLPWRKIVLYTLALFFVLYLVLPFYWIVNLSFMHEVDAASVPPHFLPYHPTLENFLGFVNPTADQALVGSRAVQDTPYALMNSLIVAFSTAVFNLVLGTFAAYSFSRIKFKGSQVLLIVYLMTRMVPGIAIIIPFYLVMRTLHLLDTYGALILSYTTFALPITIWILKDYFRSVPRELEDAARVDRCGWFRMMWSVFLPISAPGLVAAAIFSFMTAWNEFMFALFMTSTISSQTIPVIAANFATDLNTQITLMAASGVVAVAPPLILVLFFQRLILQGMAAGSVKG
ncbi:carbohydrate ABC transporter permease [Fodinicola acaciae]|uniref:carbohydrate ABC transporter permease n=1 Tax=Fodinicola acaciae TaxID=2681555 RepID=UPI0013D2A3EA|nr:carbohydrate ABC transporter permease [Fodinicola acaciae]